MTVFFSAAADRNKAPILKVLHYRLKKLDRILEIGSGTGQHATFFAAQLPSLVWQCSDLPSNLPPLKSALLQSRLENLPTPVAIDVNDEPTLIDFQAIYTANTLHIMDEISVSNFFSYADKVLTKKAQLFIYGPFKVNGDFTSESNRRFDASLRSRGVGSAIRELEWVAASLRQGAGLDLVESVEMPANNLLLTFER